MSHWIVCSLRHEYKDDPRVAQWLNGVSMLHNDYCFGYWQPGLNSNLQTFAVRHSLHNYIQFSTLSIVPSLNNDKKFKINQNNTKGQKIEHDVKNKNKRKKEILFMWSHLFNALVSLQIKLRPQSTNSSVHVSLCLNSCRYQSVQSVTFDPATQ